MLREKLVTCNGKRLEVRDVGPVIFELTARDVPIKTDRPMMILNDVDARAMLRKLIDTGLYDGGRIDGA